MVRAGSLRVIHVFILAVSLAMPSPARGRESSSSPQREDQTPIEEVLRPDGTLDLKGFRGAVDPKGWRMVLDSERGPRFVREGESGAPAPILDVAGDECWSSVTNGVNGPASALALDGLGRLYVGGYFAQAGGSPAHNVAMWNGSTWRPLGTGANAGVIALALDAAGNLYAGGLFTEIGGVTANRLARWDGSSWSPVGSATPGGGVDGLVYTLLWRGSTLYVGGAFTNADGVPANRVARWDGANWHAMGAGFNDTVRALAMDAGGTLYVGGYFATSGGTTVRGLGRWDSSASSWVQVGTGVNPGGVVWALALDGEYLYAGGNFSVIGGVLAGHIARWDPNTSSWSALGAGVSNSGVLSLAVAPNHHVYAGGYFTSAGGTTAIYVAKWTGVSWVALGEHVNGNVGALLVDPSGVVYAGGGLTEAGGAPANNVARWNGTRWSPLGGGLDGPALCVTLDGLGNLYAGGVFTAADGSTATHIVKFDGSAWSALGQGMNGFVYTLVPDGSGGLYAGGNFTMAGGAPANRVAHWNGANWSALGAGMDGTVRSLVRIGSDLYAGGLFLTAGGSASRAVARWNGTQWHSLGTGIGGAGIVYALAKDEQGNLYAGGTFPSAGGVPANNIAKWNGSSWSALGTGLNGLGALALAGDGLGNLYAGGYFSVAGGVGVNYVAKWNGSQWSSLGSGSNGNVGCILADRSGNVYVGGGFTVLGGVGVANVGRWNGTYWSAMGAGANDLVGGLALDENGHLYVAGNFTRAGDKAAGGLAHFDVPVITSVSPTFGAPGASVLLTGNNLSGVGLVAFHGTVASYTVNSNTSITATVPAGASVGRISVLGTCSTALSPEAFYSGGCAPVPPGLVSWWRFDGDATDVLGRHTGGLEGSGAYASGFQGQALAGGPGALFVVPDGPGLNAIQFTLDAWVRLDELPEGIPVVIWKGDFSGSNLTSPFELAIYGSAQAPQLAGRAFVAIGNPVGLQEVDSSVPFPLGNWVHLAATADGTTLKLYQNGELVGAAPQQLAPGPSSYPLQIGGMIGLSPANAFPGLIDEVEIHTIAASAAQIQSIYDAGPASKCPNTLGIPVVESRMTLSLAAAPNPTAADVAVSFSVPRPSSAWVEVLDVGGRRVRVLLRGELVAGAQRCVWNGRTDAGDPVASGVYLVRLRACGEERTTQVVVIRR